MFGLLPPSSSVTRFRFDSAAAFMMSWPVVVSPVKAILSTSRWPVSAAPAVGPKPGTTLTTPSGKPRFLRERRDSQRRQRRLLGRFEHAGAPGGQGRGPLPGLHQHREVPRNDLANHADRLVLRVAEIL